MGWQPLILSLRDSTLDRDVLALRMAEISQPLDEYCPKVRFAESVIRQDTDPEDSSRLLGFSGTASLSSSSHLPLNSSPRKSDIPVRFPPGRARLWTSPKPKGSVAIKTTGIVVVPLFAARAAGTLIVRMTPA